MCVGNDRKFLRWTLHEHNKNIKTTAKEKEKQIVKRSKNNKNNAHYKPICECI